ncbi:MAG: hypothetical protein KKB13_08265, partial [Chloroflexi bacterium]|nr:hypothetical protein [Chloroflexota bacterium]
MKIRCTVLKDGQPLRDPGSYGPLGRLLPPQFRLVAGAGAGTGEASRVAIELLQITPATLAANR